jgi:cytochrome c oxidase subunit III
MLDVPQINVSDLPDSAFDERSPVWWGNTLLILIESTTLILLLVGYLYCRQNFDEWPPPKTDVIPAIHDPVANLLWGTIQFFLLALTCIPMYLTDIAARQDDEPRVRKGLIFMFCVCIVSLALRWQEFHAVKFWWNDNAYASLVWTMLGLHLTYILAAAGEFFIMGLWTFTHELDPKHAHDVTLAGGYWYWVAATNALIYAAIYWFPRVT